MEKRNVGRPKSLVAPTHARVSVRLEKSTWDKVGDAAASAGMSRNCFVKRLLGSVVDDRVDIRGLLGSGEKRA